MGFTLHDRQTSSLTINFSASRPFLHRIGGSSRVRTDLANALGEGRGVTAKVRWLAKADADGVGDGRPRWIHCTPLVGHSGAVGVWMIVLVDEEGSKPRSRAPPAVARNIGGKPWEGDRDPSKESRALPVTLDDFDDVHDDVDRRAGDTGGSKAERDYLLGGTGRANAYAAKQLNDQRAPSRPPSSSGAFRREDIARAGRGSGDVSDFEFDLRTPTSSVKGSRAGR